MNRSTTFLFLFTLHISDNIFCCKPNQRYEIRKTPLESVRSLNFLQREMKRQKRHSSQKPISEYLPRLYFCLSLFNSILCFSFFSISDFFLLGLQFFSLSPTTWSSALTHDSLLTVTPPPPPSTTWQDLSRKKGDETGSNLFLDTG